MGVIQSSFTSPEHADRSKLRETPTDGEVSQDVCDAAWSIFTKNPLVKCLSYSSSDHHDSNANADIITKSRPFCPHDWPRAVVTKIAWYKKE